MILPTPARFKLIYESAYQFPEEVSADFPVSDETGRFDVKTGEYDQYTKIVHRLSSGWILMIKHKIICELSVHS